MQVHASHGIQPDVVGHGSGKDIASVADIVIVAFHLFALGFETGKGPHQFLLEGEGAGKRWIDQKDAFHARFPGGFLQFVDHAVYPALVGIENPERAEAVAGALIAHDIASELHVVPFFARQAQEGLPVQVAGVHISQQHGVLAIGFEGQGSQLRLAEAQAEIEQSALGIQVVAPPQLKTIHDLGAEPKHGTGEVIFHQGGIGLVRYLFIADVAAQFKTVGVLRRKPAKRPDRDAGFVGGRLTIGVIPHHRQRGGIVGTESEAVAPPAFIGGGISPAVTGAEIEIAQETALRKG